MGSLLNKIVHLLYDELALRAGEKSYKIQYLSAPDHMEERAGLAKRLPLIFVAKSGNGPIGIILVN